VNELALFAGAGGGILGGHLLGWRTVCAVEWEPYAASVLVARQNDGILPPFPIWDDVQTFDGNAWRGIVDVVSGGFPCQDISAAGKGAGIDGEQSGMWREMARIIHEVQPRFVFVENSPMLTSRGLGRVLGDLAQMGFDARWGVLGAADVGAPHQRDRIWIKGKMAYTKKLLGNGGNDNPRISMGGEQISEFRNSCWSENVAYFMRDRLQGVRQDGGTTGSSGLRGREGSDKEQGLQVSDSQCLGSHTKENEQVLGGPRTSKLCFEQSRSYGSDWWATEPNMGRVAHGVAAGVDRLKAIGNGQVSEVARRAWELLA
jgi:DNA (cytosine-5)-methyltransferase 1